MKLTPEERETILLYNEAEENADVYTHDKKLMEKLKKLHKKHPTQIYPKGKQSGESVTYIVPKKLISIRAPYSEERKKADSERAKKAGLTPPNRNKCPETE